MMYDRIVALHGEHMFKRSAARSPADRSVLRLVVCPRNIHTVLEIGTYRGCAAALMSQWCEKVITVDLVRGWLERDKQPFDRHGFWRSLGIDNIEFHRVHGEADKATLVNSLQFDLAFIDGEHDATVRRDFDLVRRCGRVLFHDVNEYKPKKNAVYELVRGLSVTGKLTYFTYCNMAYWQAPGTF